ncbi:MAG: hypothetical protein OEW00_12690 [candidate division Zixibacteria bacterium]|nr:hypothetical protein [candidate division Zixibacteria bacterium]
MKRQLPLFLVFIFGLFMIFQYFVPHETSEWVYEFLLDWILVIGIFALALGIWSLYLVSADKIRFRKPNWGYSYVTLAGLFVMIIFGFTAPVGESWGWYFVFVAAVLLTIGMIIQAMVASSAKGLYLGLAGLCLAVAVLVAVFDPAWGFFFRSTEGLQSTMFRAFFDHVMMPILATMFSLLAFFIASAAYRAFRARNLLASLLLVAALIVMLRFNPYLSPIFGDYVARTSNWLMNVPNLAAQRAIVIGIGLGIVSTALKVILGIERGYMGKG